MDNPYKPPQSSDLIEPLEGASKENKRSFQSALLVLFAALCTLQFWRVLFLILDHWNSFGPDAYATAAALLPGLVRPGLLFLSSVLLAFHRKLAVYGLAAYVVTGLLIMPETGRAAVVLPLLLISLVLMYSLHLLKSGALR